LAMFHGNVILPKGLDNVLLTCCSCSSEARACILPCAKCEPVFIAMEYFHNQKLYLLREPTALRSNPARPDEIEFERTASMSVQKKGNMGAVQAEKEVQGGTFADMRSGEGKKEAKKVGFADFPEERKEAPKGSPLKRYSKALGSKVKGGFNKKENIKSHSAGRSDWFVGWNDYVAGLVPFHKFNLSELKRLFTTKVDNEPLGSWASHADRLMTRSSAPGQERAPILERRKSRADSSQKVPSQQGDGYKKHYWE